MSVKVKINGEWVVQGSNSTSMTNITASAEGDEVITLVGTGGTNQVSYKASHAKVETSGTFTKVTTDEYGHVVSGANPNTLADLGITDVYTKEEIDFTINGLTKDFGDALQGAYAPVRDQLDTAATPIEQIINRSTLSKIDYNTYNLCYYYGENVEFFLGQIRYYDYDYGFSVTNLPLIDTVRIESRCRHNNSVYTFYNSDVISRETQPNWDVDFKEKVHDIYLVIDAEESSGYLSRATLTGVICRNERAYDRILQIVEENAKLKYIPDLYNPGDVDFNDKGIITYVDNAYGSLNGTTEGVTFAKTYNKDGSCVLTVNGTANDDFLLPIYNVAFYESYGAITFYGTHESAFQSENNSDYLNPNGVYPFTFTNNLYTLSNINMPYTIHEEDFNDGFGFETSYAILTLCMSVKKGETFNSTRIEYNYYPSTSTGTLLKHHHVDINYLNDSIFENRATYSNINSFEITAEDDIVAGSSGRNAIFTNNGDNTFTISNNLTSYDIPDSLPDDGYIYKFLIGSYTFDDTPYGYSITGIPTNLEVTAIDGVILLIEATDGSGKIEITKNTEKLYLKTNDITGFEAYNSDWYAIKGKSVNVYLAQRNNYSISSVNDTFDFSNFKIDKCVSSHDIMKQHSEAIAALENKINNGEIGGGSGCTCADISAIADVDIRALFEPEKEGV